MKRIFTLILLLIVPFFSLANGEQIAITITSGQLPIIDGTGSYSTEWKQSAEHVVSYPDGARLAFRSVHDRDNVYLLLDMITDTIIDNNRDFGIVCFDTKNDSGDRPNDDDYCFIATEGSNVFITYRGGGDFGISDYLNKVPNPKGVKAIAGISNKFDRYTEISHAIYEFEIPTEIITRANVYGIYYAVYDANTGKVYSWPENFDSRYPYVPAPDHWGKLVSPDNSLPEFSSASIAVLAGVLIFFVIATRIKIIKVWHNSRIINLNNHESNEVKVT